MKNNIYVVATPIGNLGDITKRAIDVLTKNNVLFCEDTRVTRSLLNHLNIKEKKLLSLHKYNENQRLDLVIKYLDQEDIVIVSDAGTPTISDPGGVVLEKLRIKGYKIIPIPGANSITTALQGSGLVFNTFAFIGFLEKKETGLINQIRSNLKNKSDVLIAFESPKRINKTLVIIEKHFGDIEIMIARELTKKFETFYYDRVSKLKDQNYKGEIVVVFPSKNIDDKKMNIEEEIEFLKSLGLHSAIIKKILSRYSNESKNAIYNKTKEN